MAQSRCCCGRSECAYVRHNHAAMEGLEKDLRSAAQIGQVGESFDQSLRARSTYLAVAYCSGAPDSSLIMGPDNSLTFALQALLERHETYMAEAEKERCEMAASIDKLEMDKRELEASNARTIEENRNLLDQLEDLNNNVNNSDAHITSLNATLQSTRKEMERLTMLAAQTQQLEAQISAMELEQVSLQERLASTEEEERSAVHRWKNAERTINNLHEQIDRIEREARDEQERHAEVLGRLERRRAMERKLERAEGHLKGAAAATTLGRDGGGSTVVSHFVKDILQDNANLQSGIAELREILMGSNQEVENLREQIMLHQPIRSDQDDGIRKAMLDGEVLKSSTTEALPELHVHHHYHAATKETTLRERASGTRRPKKKRNVLMSGYATPSSGSQTPRTYGAYGLRAAPPPSAAVILSHTSVSVPPPPQPRFAHRWSSQSSQTWSSNAPSSVPSSPQSTAIFDVDVSIASTRPTSPEPMSPDLSPYLSQHRKGNSDISFRSLSASVFQDPAGNNDKHPAHIASPSITHSDSDTIQEEPENDTLPPNTNDIHTLIQPFRPRLHRSASHESILSISALALASTHTGHPPQPRHPSYPTPHHHPFPISTSSTTPITSSTPFLARASFRPPSHLNPSSRLLLPSRPPSAATSALAQTATTLGRNSLGKRVGGWVWGNWGGAPVASSVGGSREKAAAEGGEQKAMRAPRPPGVNQRGSLGHLKREESRVEVGGVDEGLLREMLGEG